MSHGNMTMAQAKELQRQYGGRVISTGLAGDQRVSHHKPTDRVEDFKLALHRNGDHDAILQSTVVVMKSRKTRTGVESRVIQKFDL